MAHAKFSPSRDRQPMNQLNESLNPLRRFLLLNRASFNCNKIFHTLIGSCFSVARRESVIHSELISSFRSFPSVHQMRSGDICKFNGKLLCVAHMDLVMADWTGLIHQNQVVIVTEIDSIE